MLFAATDGLLETRRAGLTFFGDDQLTELLPERRRTTPPQALAELVFARRTLGAQAPRRRRRPRRTSLAERLRREPPGSPAARALFEEYLALVRERLGPAFAPTEAIFASERSFDEPGAAFLVVYAESAPSAAAACARSAPEWSRSSGCS